MKYNPAIVKDYFKECGLPEPQTEVLFHPTRKWRFDFSWPDADKLVALEVDGGIWIHGGHNRGAQIKKTWEKENEAQILGWKILKVEPKDLCTKETVELVRRALKTGTQWKSS
jgi:hypothetical protein